MDKKPGSGPTEMIVLGVRATTGNPHVESGANVVVIGMGPKQIEELMVGEPVWIEMPSHVPSILLFYGRNVEAMRQVLQERLGMNWDDIVRAPPPGKAA